jgi:cytoskeletal protein RodZ
MEMFYKIGSVMKEKGINPLGGIIIKPYGKGGKRMRKVIVLATAFAFIFGTGIFTAFGNDTFKALREKEGIPKQQTLHLEDAKDKKKEEAKAPAAKAQEAKAPAAKAPEAKAPAAPAPEQKVAPAEQKAQTAKKPASKKKAAKKAPKEDEKKKE